MNNEHISTGQDKFEVYPSTRVGREGERLTRDLCKLELEAIITKDISIGYDTTGDFKAILDGKEVLIEVKVDAFEHETGNLPLEYQQEGKDGIMRDSGILVSKADWLAIYCKRQDKLYIIDMLVIKQLIDSEDIKGFDSCTCNRTSKTGKTECYLAPISILEGCKAIIKEHYNVQTTLSKRGLSYNFEPEIEPEE